MIGIVFQKPIFQYQLNTLNGVKNKCGGQRKKLRGPLRPASRWLDHPVSYDRTKNSD